MCETFGQQHLNGNVKRAHAHRDDGTQDVSVRRERAQYATCTGHAVKGERQFVYFHHGYCYFYGYVAHVRTRDEVSCVMWRDTLKHKRCNVNIIDEQRNRLAKGAQCSGLKQ